MMAASSVLLKRKTCDTWRNTYLPCLLAHKEPKVWFLWKSWNHRVTLRAGDATSVNDPLCQRTTWPADVLWPDLCNGIIPFVWPASVHCLCVVWFFQTKHIYLYSTNKSTSFLPINLHIHRVGLVTDNKRHHKSSQTGVVS